MENAVPLPATNLGEQHSRVSAQIPFSTWSEDVLAVAERLELLPYLDPMLKATREIFPAASSIRVYSKEDPELPDAKHIVFDVQIGGLTSAQYRAAHKAWNKEFLRLHRKPLIHIFSLLLDILD